MTEITAQQLDAWARELTNAARLLIPPRQTAMADQAFAELEDRRRDGEEISTDEYLATAESLGGKRWVAAGNLRLIAEQMRSITEAGR
jgi:hypothetical protein